jgi:hypothetical protein
MNTYSEKEHARMTVDYRAIPHDGRCSQPVYWIEYDAATVRNSAVVSPTMYR